MDYTFVDNYLVAAPDIGYHLTCDSDSRGGLSRCRIRIRFQALLPTDGYTNFSAIFYHNIGPVVGPLADQLKSSGASTSAAATVGRRAESQFGAWLDLCLWRARPDRGRQQHRLHGI